MDEQGLDDLFGDPLSESLNGDQIQQQLDIGDPTPPPAGLAERVDALRLGGCNDKIAWSKSGAVAYLTKDKKDVKICALRFRSETGEWTKSIHTDPHFTNHLRVAFKLRDLAHLSWNTSAPDLLVADACGRIVLFTPLIAINRPTSTKIFAWDQDDSLNALVGMIWINQKRQMRLSHGSVRADGQWRHMVRSVDPTGPFCPQSIPPGGSRSAFIAVTRRSTIIVGYQPPQSQAYTDLKHDLEGFTSSSDALTHAALCPYKDDQILLATHTESKNVRLYTLKLNWHQTNPTQPPTGPLALESQHLTTIDFCHPNSDSHWSFQPPSLTRLEIIPRSYMDKNASLNPTILAAFAEHDPTNNRQPMRTILSRWELKEAKPALDAAFSQLSTKKSGSNELQPELELHRMEDIRIDRVILHMQMQQHNETWTLCSSDGVVEFRGRSFDILSMDDNPDRLTGLSQLGFSLTTPTPCLHVALSPNCAVKGYMGKDHEFEIAVMQLPIEMLELGTIATMDKIAITLVIANAIAESAPAGNCTNDDIVMMISRFMGLLSEEQKTQFHDQFLKETYKILGMVDKLTDLQQFERTIRLGLMSRCHSVQAALGNRGEKLGRTIPSKLAFMALNLKAITIAFTMAYYSNPKPAAGNAASQANPAARQDIGPDSDLNRQDVLHYITHLAAWYMKLTDYAIDQVLDLNRALDVAVDGEADLDVLRLRIFASNSPALPLLLGCFTRMLLRRSSNGLRALAMSVSKPWTHYPSPTAPSWDAFRRALQAPAAPPPLVEMLLNELDERCKRQFAEAGLGDAARGECELDLMVRGIVPDVLLPVAGWLVTHGVERLRGGGHAQNQQGQQQQHHHPQAALPAAAEAELAFADWSPLGLGDDPRSRRWRRDVVYDGVQKKEIGLRRAVAARLRDDALRLRSCTRCATVMEDQLPPRAKDAKHPPIFHSFRLCVCGAHFVTDRADEWSVGGAMDGDQDEDD